MYTILDNRYLKLELFNGYNYGEGGSADHDVIGQPRNRDTFSKTKFDKTYVIFDLSAFVLERTDKKWFQGNRIMRNLGELNLDMDSVDYSIKKSRLNIYENLISLSSPLSKSFDHQLPPELEVIKYIRDSSMDVSSTEPQVKSIRKAQQAAAREIRNVKENKFNLVKKKALADKRLRTSTFENVDSIFRNDPKRDEVSGALILTRTIKSQLTGAMDAIKSQRYEFNIFRIQWHKILASSFACVAMFLIGAPLGAIIKRGGLGVPVLVSILFFIFYYVMSITGEKWAKQELVTVPFGIWTPDFVLLIFGLLFLRQARIDARLFESDFYQVMIEKIIRRFNNSAPENH
jgi:lipopolysaccharide export system permease protein